MTIHVLSSSLGMLKVVDKTNPSRINRCGYTFPRQAGPKLTTTSEESHVF